MRAHRHEMIFSISETTIASNFKFCHNVAHDSLCISTGNMSQSTSGRQQIAQTCQLWLMFGLRILDNGSIDFNRLYNFGKGDSRTSSFVA